MRIRFFLFIVLNLAACALAQAGEVFLETFRSEAIGRDYRYTIYLPDANKKDERKYPVLYLLHGAGGDDQPTSVELRVVDGDHEWMALRDTFSDALQFMNARITGPR